MQFVVIGRDGNDAGAMERRMAARAGHIAICDKLASRGELLYGTALLDENGKMCGSVILCDFPDREALDAWLREEPYVTNRVWESVEVSACRVGPTFEPVLAKMKAK
jgi:uncharacterized protein YciI